MRFICTNELEVDIRKAWKMAANQSTDLNWNQRERVWNNNYLSIRILCSTNYIWYQALVEVSDVFMDTPFPEISIKLWF